MRSTTFGSGGKLLFLRVAQDTSVHIRRVGLPDKVQTAERRWHSLFGPLLYREEQEPQRVEPHEEVVDAPNVGKQSPRETIPSLAVYAETPANSSLEVAEEALCWVRCATGRCDELACGVVAGGMVVVGPQPRVALVGVRRDGASTIDDSRNLAQHLLFGPVHEVSADCSYHHAAALRVANLVDALKKKLYRFT